MNNKQRVEPEINVPEELGAQPSNEVSLEDLVPGLEEEIERQEAGEDGSAEVDALLGRITELEAERDQFKDKWMRALSDAENVRKRAERDKSDAQTYAGTKLARDLLSVHDNLERAMAAADDELRETAAYFMEGLELTQRELLNAFGKHKIEKVSPEAGEKFDPNRHQAMFEAPIPGAEAGTVIECMQAGFVIADRLLRPAMVGIAKAAPEPVGDTEEDG